MILNVAFFEPSLEPHAFVIVSYQDGSINKTNKLLIDPLFEEFVNKYNIIPTHDNASMFENLKHNGVIFANQNEIYKYLLIFYNAELKKENKQKTDVK